MFRLVLGSRVGIYDPKHVVINVILRRLYGVYVGLCKWAYVLKEFMVVYRRLLGVER